MNNNQFYINKINEIINNKCFKAELKSNADNFPNLKLENHIRNTLVVMFNRSFGYDLRALAEYPRNSKNKQRVSVDFAVCENQKVDFTMEMKYSFPNDHLQMTHYSNIIRTDFLNRKYGDGSNDFINAFLHIICETDKDKLEEFEGCFNSPDLNCVSQYQISNNKKKKADWVTNLKNSFETIKNEAEITGVICGLKEITPIKIYTRDELEMTFHFFLLYRI